MREADHLTNAENELKEEASIGSRPLVSIIIPSYNYANFLDEAIGSVLNQDYPNIELIVLDDGSRDNTREVLSKYTGRFYWETQENMGQADTLTKGWAMSEGQILGRLSADDVLLPNAVSKSVEHLLANPDAVLVYCDFAFVDEDSHVLRRIVAPETSYHDMVVKNVCPPGPGAFFTRDAYLAAGPWDSTLNQTLDYEFFLRLGLLGKFIKIPEILAWFRVHEESQTFAVADEAKSEESVKIMADYYKRKDVPPDVLVAKNEALSNAYVFTARSHFRSRRYAKGFIRLLQGLALYPRNASIRTARIVAYGLFNHIRHRLMQRIRTASKRRLFGA